MSNKLQIFDETKASSDFEEVVAGLESIHVLFYQLTSLGTPEFTKEIDTGAVAFDKFSNKIRFMWNPDFWMTLSYEQRKFIASHEALHVFLSHGKRSIDAKQPQLANIAMDVVINEMLLNEFGFSRNDIGDLSEKLIFFDNTFGNDDDILRGQSFEYYYKKLIKKVKEEISKGNISKGTQGEGGITLYPDEELGNVFNDLADSHESLKEFDESAEKAIENKFDDSVSDYDKEAFGKSTKADSKPGSLSGKLSYVIKKKKTKYNNKWSDIIINWKYKNSKLNEFEDSWHYPNRRITSLKPNVFLPSEYDGNLRGKGKKVSVWLFMDTSYSCIQLKDKFFTAVDSFPLDKFDLKCFCFDTKVYNVSLKKRKLYGFGGTKFDIIEKSIQETMSDQNTSYPDVVFIFTDGQGTRVVPEHPSRWYWFLGGSYPTDRFIDKTSKKYNLKDFQK